MDSIGFLSTIYTVFVSVIITFIVLLLIYRVYSVIVKNRPRRSILNSEISVYVKLLKIGFGTSMLLIVIIAPIYAYIGSAFKTIIPSPLNHTLVFVTLCLGIFELYLSKSVSEKLVQKKLKKIVLSIIVILMLPVSIYMAIYVPELFDFPDEEESYLIELPVRGTWVAGHAGGSVSTNYHNAIKAQQYAIDIVRVNERGRFYTNDGSELEDVFSFGEPVYSPVDGIVIALVDTLPNSEITLAPSNSLNPAGNHVVIEFETDRFVFLAHLESYSISINKGDTISVGDFIGTIGNSGNTSWPHLHMHIQDLPTIDNQNATGFPFRFKNMERKRWLIWSTINNGHLTRNDFLRVVN